MSSIVRAAARTGTDSRRRKLVIRIDQTNSVISVQRTLFILAIVVIKLIDPKREENPATCREKIR